jgi:uncharacterized membrane protein
MIWRALFFAAAVAVVAGIVHISVLLLIPLFGVKDAYANIEKSFAPFKFQPVKGAGSGRILSDTDPFFEYGSCRFELARSGMYMSGPKIDSFWSATILDEDGSVIYSLNSRTAIDNKLDVIMLDPAGILLLRELQPPEAESAIVVETEARAGFVVVRVLRPDASWTDKAASFLSAVECRPYSLEAPQS